MAVNAQPECSTVWQKYYAFRVSSTHFYQWLRRQLSPLSQSDSRIAAWGRDFAFTWMYRIPYVRKEMAVTISGLKTGIFTGMKMEDVEKR